MSYPASVSLLATWHKTTDPIFVGGFKRSIHLLIKFWKSSVSESGSTNFLSIFQHCEIGHFPQFGTYLWKKMIGSSWKNCRKCSLSLGKEVPIKFWKSSWSGHQIWTGFALADVCALRVLSFESEIINSVVILRVKTIRRLDLNCYLKFKHT